MIVCYVQGGGLGHLTRVRAYLHTCHADEPSVLLTTSPFAADPRVLGPHRLLHAGPPASSPARSGLAHPLPGDLASVLCDLSPSLLVVDAFPAGLTGELNAALVPPGTATVHLARLLRWDAYRPMIPDDPVRFDRTWLLEDLDPAHRAWLTGEVAPLTLIDPPAPVLPDLPAGSWLVLHSGPAAEIHDLLAYARECAAAENLRPRFVLVSPVRPSGLPADVQHTDPYPAWPLFSSAARIITAAGFNAVRQTRPWRAKHRMLPFPRCWDDQFRRASRIRAG